MNDEFFDDLKKQIEQERLTKEVRSLIRSENAGYAVPALAEMQGIIQDLAGKLEKLGYQCKVTLSRTHVDFTLTWANGSDVSISYELSDNHTQLVSNYFDSNFSQVLSVPMIRTLDKRDFDPENEKELLKTAVKDFTDVALRHGGIN